MKTDRRDAKKLVRLYRAGELVFVQPPSPAQEGLRDLVRCRDDLRRAAVPYMGSDGGHDDEVGGEAGVGRHFR